MNALPTIRPLGELTSTVTIQRLARHGSQRIAIDLFGVRRVQRYGCADALIRLVENGSGRRRLSLQVTWVPGTLTRSQEQQVIAFHL